MGATVAPLLSGALWLVSLSRNKQWVFAVAALLIADKMAYHYIIAPKQQGRNGACDPGDPTARDVPAVSNALCFGVRQQSTG